jgi:ferric-dicitrate binding protein FerR (iron transport regulator)
MKKLIALSLCFGCFAAVSTSSAIDLKSSKVTQVVNDVQIISATDQTKKNASVNDIFTMPDILRTGPASRAELVAPDETVTRVGANTIFSFDPANRTIDLQQGSLLFHSPHGKGGGTIHTGSATASVLGTTLIVTTTLGGGLKVIDLEGEVEVKFLNGLSQSLDPGQMTFILPGGNQASPIIIFRLDDLTKNSLLVKGFNQPLSSMPLILNQIEKQIKLIKSGQATDTGLLVGDNANSGQVEVLDMNTIQSAFNSSAVKKALGADATINQPSLTGATIPSPPNHVFTDQPFLLPDNKFFAGLSFSGFAARNIFINTHAADSLTVDMSPYAKESEFDMVAANNLNIEGPVTFGGFSPETSIYFFLVAGNQISIAPDSTVEADIGNFGLTAPGALTLDGVSLQNIVGNISITSGSDVTVENASFIRAFANLSIKAGGNLAMSGSTVSADSTSLTSSGGTLSLDSSTLNVNSSAILSASQSMTVNNSTINADPNSGGVAINSSSGSVTVTGTSIQAHYLSLNSGDGILLDAGGQTLTATGDGATANLTAVNTITVNNADFSSWGVVNMAANTINIVNVIFGTTGIYNFGTPTGLFAINPTVALSGGLNIYNSYIGSVPISNTSQVNASSGPGTTAGLYSYAIGGHGN